MKGHLVLLLLNDVGKGNVVIHQIGEAGMIEEGEVHLLMIDGIVIQEIEVEKGREEEVLVLLHRKEDSKALLRLKILQLEKVY